jgi:hypothetical protein
MLARRLPTILRPMFGGFAAHYGAPLALVNQSTL